MEGCSCLEWAFWDIVSLCWRLYVMSFFLRYHVCMMARLSNNVWDLGWNFCDTVHFCRSHELRDVGLDKYMPQSLTIVVGAGNFQLLVVPKDSLLICTVLCQWKMLRYLAVFKITVLCVPRSSAQFADWKGDVSFRSETFRGIVCFAVLCFCWLEGFCPLLWCWSRTCKLWAAFSAMLPLTYSDTRTSAVSLFFGGIGGAFFLLSALLSVAWKRYHDRRTPTEDDLEMLRYAAYGRHFLPCEDVDFAGPRAMSRSVWSPCEICLKNHSDIFPCADRKNVIKISPQLWFNSDFLRFLRLMRTDRASRMLFNCLQ